MMTHSICVFDLQMFNATEEIEKAAKYPEIRLMTVGMHASEIWDCGETTKQPCTENIYMQAETGEIFFLSRVVL